MPDVSIKVMSMNPKREYSIEVKGLDQEQLPDYVSKTYRDLIDLLGAEQIDIKVDSVAITADTKKLKAKWTPELQQDINAYHNLDAEVELTGILSEQIALEIDQEIEQGGGIYTVQTLSRALLSVRKCPQKGNIHQLSQVII